jgi:hypothetical protein
MHRTEAITVERRRRWSWGDKQQIVGQDPDAWCQHQRSGATLWAAPEPGLRRGSARAWTRLWGSI